VIARVRTRVFNRPSVKVVKRSRSALANFLSLGQSLAVEENVRTLLNYL
jgi:hypothetical protein